MQVSHLNPIPVSISNVIPYLVQIDGIIGLQREPTAKAVDHHLKTNLYQTIEDFRIVRRVVKRKLNHHLQMEVAPWCRVL